MTVERVREQMIARRCEPEEEEIEQDIQQRMVPDHHPWQKHFIGSTIGKASVDIQWQDLNLLRPGEWLNDDLVVGGAVLIAGEGRSSQRSLYVFSSHFLSRSLSKGTFDYESVKAWSKQADVFHYDYILFPICQNYHWYFVVVCHLASWRAWQGHPQFPDLDKPGSLDSSIDAIRPTVLILDPLAQQRGDVCSLLKQYLTMEAQYKEGISLRDSDFDTSVARCLPVQQDGHDCGIYSLAYWEHFCHDPGEFVRHVSERHGISQGRVSVQPCARIRVDARERLDAFIRRQHDRHACGYPFTVPDRRGLLIEVGPVARRVESRRSIETYPAPAADGPNVLGSLGQVHLQDGSQSERHPLISEWRLQLKRVGRSIRHFVEIYLQYPSDVVEPVEPRALADLELLRTTLFGKGTHDCGAFDLYSPPVRDYILTCAYLNMAVTLWPQENASNSGVWARQKRSQRALPSQHASDLQPREIGSSDAPQWSRQPLDRSYDALVDRFLDLLPHLHVVRRSTPPNPAKRALRALLREAFYHGHVFRGALATDPEYRLFIPYHAEHFEKTTMAEISTAQTGGELVAVCVRPGVQTVSLEVVERPALITMPLCLCDRSDQSEAAAPTTSKIASLTDGTVRHQDGDISVCPHMMSTDHRSGVPELDDTRGESAASKTDMDNILDVVKDDTRLAAGPVVKDHMSPERQPSSTDPTLVDGMEALKGPNEQGMDTFTGAVELGMSSSIEPVEPQEKWMEVSPPKRKRLPNGEDDAIKSKRNRRAWKSGESESPVTRDGALANSSANAPQYSVDSPEGWEEDDVRILRYRLQRGLLSANIPRGEELMPRMSGYLAHLEAWKEVDLKIIKNTKIHKVLKGVLRLESIPRDEEFQFSVRTSALLARWKRSCSNNEGGSGVTMEKPRF